MLFYFLVQMLLDLKQKIVAALVCEEAKKLKIQFLYLYIINCSLFAQVDIYFYLNGLVDCWIGSEKFGNPLLIFWRERFSQNILDSKPKPNSSIFFQI